MIWAPACDERVVSECHDRSCICISVCRELLYRNLSLGSLEHTTERHEDCRTADCRVEHLDETLLRCHVRILEVVEDLLLEVLTLDCALKRILVLDCAYGSLCIMLGSRAVDEFA